MKRASSSAGAPRSATIRTGTLRVAASWRAIAVAADSAGESNSGDIGSPEQQLPRQCAAPRILQVSVCARPREWKFLLCVPEVSFSGMCPVKRAHRECAHDEPRPRPRILATRPRCGDEDDGGYENSRSANDVCPIYATLRSTLGATERFEAVDQYLVLAAQLHLDEPGARSCRGGARTPACRARGSCPSATARGRRSSTGPRGPRVWYPTESR